MANSEGGSFARADFFQLFDGGVAASSSSLSESEGNESMNESQYVALVHMMASRLGLAATEAERLFPSYKLHEDAVHGAGSSATLREPPLCAHLSREGVARYWSTPSAHTIPEVRCCDVREEASPGLFPASGHGPHVHCLFCFHAAVETAGPPGRGVPPPVVGDFRDAETLRAHQQSHHDRYLTYLQLLEDCSSGNFDIAADMLSDEGKAACEDAAEVEGRHVCYMAAMGTSACPVLVFYCAECDSFAPLLQLHPCGATQTWTSTEGRHVILSRLLLSCHLLYMMDATRFAAPGENAGEGRSAAHRTRRHLIFLFRPILFHEGVEEALIEEFEAEAACTHVAVVLPDASVSGSPAELLLLEKEHVGEETASASTTYGPAVVGFAMEWDSEALLRSKLELVLRQNEAGGHDTTAPFHVATRWVYVEDTEEWARAEVVYHRSVATRAELPSAYTDAADEGIRVVGSYQIDAPLPLTESTSESSAAGSSPEPLHSAIVERASNDDSDAEEDPLALDGCPYSMESRTVDFFSRMTALAKAMHELSTWRQSIDENKESPP